MIKKRLVDLLSDSKKYIAHNIIWQWLALCSQIIIVFTVAGIIADTLAGTAGNGSASVLQPALFIKLIVIAAAIILRVVCDRSAVKASNRASTDVKRILRDQIYSKLLRLGPAYKEHVNTSEIVQLSTEGVEQLEIYFGKYLPQFFYSLLAPLTLFVLLAFVDFPSALTLLVCVPLIPVSIVVVQKIAKKLLNRYWGIYAELGDSFLENLQGLTTLKIYQADQQKADEMDQEAQHFRQITMKVLTMQLNSTSVMDIIAYGGAAVGILVAVNGYFAGRMDLASVLVIILLASEFFIPLRLLGSFFHIAMNGMSASDKIFALLDIEEPEQGTESLERMEAQEYSIRMEQVNFAYDERKPVLSGIDMMIPSGSFAALVGKSGCGKSTIASLLTGKKNAANKNADEKSGFTGEITIAGKPVTQIAEAELMRTVTLVKHDSYLPKGTVEVCLKMANEHATVSRMKEVLEQVNLLSFLEEQDGLQTQLLENASNLSGGQRQRLSIARALLHDSPVYIFDEATSNIDIESEELIMDVINELAKVKTVILISHRLENVKRADQVYMLEEGKISESGTHEELIRKNAGYAKLYKEQKKLEEYSTETEYTEKVRANQIKAGKLNEQRKDQFNADLTEEV